MSANDLSWFEKHGTGTERVTAEFVIDNKGLLCAKGVVFRAALEKSERAEELSALSTDFHQHLREYKSFKEKYNAFKKNIKRATLAPSPVNSPRELTQVCHRDRVCPAGVHP